MLTKEPIVKEVMMPCSAKLTTDSSVKYACDIIKENKVIGLPVMNDNDVIVGLFTIHNLISIDFKELDKIKVSEVMDKNVVTVKYDLPVSKVLELPHNFFPVVDENKNYVGIITRDCIGWALFKRSVKIIKHVEAILDSAHNGIVAVNKDGIVTLFNQAAVNITWRPKEQAIGKHLSQVVIPQGLLEILRDGRELKHYKFTVNYSKGPRIYITNRTPIIENGEVAGAVGVFQDISEIEFLSEELSTVKELNRKLESIIESSYDGILVIDAQGTVSKANKAHERITGIPSEYIEGKSIYELETLDYKNLVEKVIKEKKINIM